MEPAIASGLWNVAKPFWDALVAKVQKRFAGKKDQKEADKLFAELNTLTLAERPAYDAIAYRLERLQTLQGVPSPELRRLQAAFEGICALAEIPATTTFRELVRPTAQKKFAKKGDGGGRVTRYMVRQNPKEYGTRAPKKKSAAKKATTKKSARKKAAGRRTRRPAR